MALCAPMLGATRLNPEFHHYIGVNGMLGGSLWMNNVSQVKAGFGVSPEVGVNYRIYRNHFLFDLGLDAQYSYNPSTIPSAKMQLAMLDTEGDPFTLNAALSECVDKSHTLNAMIPIAIGAEYKRFFFLAGVKVGLNLLGWAKSEALLETKGQYDKYFEQLENLPNHELYAGREISSSTYALRLNPSVMAHFEIGARVDRMSDRLAFIDHPYRMYVSLYADYGLLNIHKNKQADTSIGYRETDSGVQFYTTPAMVSELMMSSKVNPITIGLKFTTCFFLPTKKICIHCD